MNKKALWILVFVLFAVITVKAASATQIIASNFEEGNVLFIDTETNETTDIRVGDGPNKIAISWDNELAVVTNTLSGTVSVISLEKKAVLSDVRVGEEPIGVTATYDSGYALVANSKSRSVSVLDLGTLEIVKEIEVGDQPIDIAVSNDDSKAYVSTIGDNRVSVIDLEGLEVVSYFSNAEVLRSPAELQVTPNDRYVYVLDTRNDHLAIIDLEENKVLEEYIKTNNLNINNELILGNQFALLSASRDGHGIIQVIDFDEHYARVLTETRGTISGIDFSDGRLFIANDEEIDEIDTTTGSRSTIELDSKVTDVAIIGKQRTVYVPPEKSRISKETVKIIVIVAVILIILILIFWRGPGPAKGNDIEKSRKAKKKIKKKTRKRQKTNKKKSGKKRKNTQKKG